jgi:hypothetical protein
MVGVVVKWCVQSDAAPSTQVIDARLPVSSTFVVRVWTCEWGHAAAAYPVLTDLVIQSANITTTSQESLYDFRSDGRVWKY